MTKSFLSQLRDASVTISDYPEDYIALIELVHGDVGHELEVYEQRTPADAPQNIFREHDHGSIAFVNGKATLPRLLGRAYEFGIAEDPRGGFWSMGHADEQLNEDQQIGLRLSWIEDNAQSGHTIWWRRRDTGDGILLDDYDYFVVFHDAADDAAFLAAFPEAGA